MAEPTHPWAAFVVGPVCGNPTSASAVATLDHSCLGGRGESRLKNPLREICTVGSVRGEISGELWSTYPGTKLETADTAKENLKLTGSPLLGGPISDVVGAPPSRVSFAWKYTRKFGSKR